MPEKEKVSFEDWKKESHKQQENINLQLRDRIWDEFKLPDEENYLFQKIAVALFGPPKTESPDHGLSDEQKDLVNNLKGKCIEHNIHKDRICIALLFVYVYINEETQVAVPVIRSRSISSENFNDIHKNTFIDHEGRVYSSWSHYKDENTWEESWLCVPENGYYEKEVAIAILDQSSRGKVVNALDKAANVTNIISTVGMVVGTILSFIPFTAPIGVPLVTISAAVGAPGAIYGTGRSIEKLVDRSNHEESISLKDPEARQLWLQTATGILSIGTLGSAKALVYGVEAGATASTAARMSFMALEITSVSVAGAAVLNQLYEMIIHKDEITALDVFQLTTSIFFFTHSVISFRTASTFIKDAQSREISKIRDNIHPAAKEEFDAFLQAAKENVDKGKIREMHGQAQFIREMKRIDDLNEFYSHFEIRHDGQYSINRQLTIHPRAFVEMSETERQTVLNLSRKLNYNEISWKDFNKEMAPIQKEYRLRLDRHRVEAEAYVKRVFGVENLEDIEFNGKRVENIKPIELDRLEQVVKNSFSNADPNLLRIARAFADKHGASNVTEFAAAGEYAVRRVEEEVAVRRQREPNPPREPGIKARDFYRRQVVDEILGDEVRMNDLNNMFQQLRNICDAANTCKPRFGNSMAAANHYDKHALFPKIDPNNNVSPEDYFNMAAEMANGPISDIKWTQDGSSLKCVFNSEQYGATAITFENLANGTTVVATLMTANVTETRLYNNNQN